MIVFAITIQMTTRSSHQRCSVRKGVLRNFAKFTGARFSFIKEMMYLSLIEEEIETIICRKVGVFRGT